MSLFNRPAWAKSQTSELDESEANLFSHSDRSYRDIVAEQERKKKAKIERQKAKEERRLSDKRKVKDEASGSDGAKRRRITLEDGEALLSTIGLSSKTALGAHEKDDVGCEVINAPVRSSPRNIKHANYESPRTSKLCNKAPQAIEIQEEDTEDEPVIIGPSTREAEPTDDESDEELAELKRRARRQREQKELQNKSSKTPDIATHSPSPGIGIADTGQRSLPTPPPEPIVQLFISSRIPNTNPLIVTRKLSQRLEEVRKAWCKKQGFPHELSNDVFFVHRLRRVYDVTTCKSLGLEVDAFGNLTMKGAEGKEGVEKIHLEAVTEEIFQQMKHEKAQESKRRNGELPPEESGEAGAEDPEQPQKEESIIRLTLKAKGRDDFKLKVKPTTLFSKIVAAYSKSLLENGESAWLDFDGERLNPEDEVQNTEVSDLDCIQVHVI